MLKAVYSDQSYWVSRLQEVLTNTNTRAWTLAMNHVMQPHTDDPTSTWIQHDSLFKVWTISPLAPFARVITVSPSKCSVRLSACTSFNRHQNRFSYANDDHIWYETDLENLFIGLFKALSNHKDARPTPTWVPHRKSHPVSSPSHSNNSTTIFRLFSNQ
jgi:hypothetical protein